MTDEQRVPLTVNDDHLLPRAVPRHVGVMVASLVVVVLMAMAIAGAVGGVNWLIAVGGVGTAFGTLGLAYFTFTVATRTTYLVASSQRLEKAAMQELSAGRKQAQAAATTALEAQKSRVDAFAPIIDFKVQWAQGYVRPKGTTPAPTIELSTTPGQNANLDQVAFTAHLDLIFENFGRTPGFAKVKSVGAPFDGQDEFIRVDPGPDNRRRFRAGVDYLGPPEELFAPRTIFYKIQVQGAMTTDTVDTIGWRGKLTLLERDPRGWHLHSDPLRLKDYWVTRKHGFVPGRNGTVDG